MYDLCVGSLIFDEANLELHADNILITDGGALQVAFDCQSVRCMACCTH